MKQDNVKIKTIALLTEAKIVKKEIKEIKEENPTDKKFDGSDGDRQNFLSFIDRVIVQKWHTEINFVINKEFSLTEIASGADMNCIQEGLIPLKYYDKSSERLIQANREKKIINYKIPNIHICHDGIYFETVFVLIKDLPSKIILGTPFMALLYPFLVTDKGIKTNVLRKDIFFRFIVPPVLKEKTLFQKGYYFNRYQRKRNL